MNPAITAAIIAASAENPTSMDAVIERLRKEKALTSDKAIAYQPANQSEQKFLDEALGRGLVMRRADGRYYLNERAVTDRSEGMGFALLLVLLAIASIVASITALVIFANN